MDVSFCKHNNQTRASRKERGERGLTLETSVVETNEAIGESTENQAIDRREITTEDRFAAFLQRRKSTREVEGRGEGTNDGLDGFQCFDVPQFQRLIPR